MHIDTATGLINAARQVASPNCDDRPPATQVDLVVVHAISLPPGEFGGSDVDRLFTCTLDPCAHPYFETIAHLRVSAHLLIGREGQLTQYVPFHRRAWHAGESCFLGRRACNDFSIGIELEGTDDTPYTEAQYGTLVPVLHSLMTAYPGVDARRIVGHCDIAPGRKTDPGPSFDWPRLLRGLTA